MIEGIDSDTGEIIDVQPLLADWYKSMTAAELAKQVIANEQDLRKKIVKVLFPAPKEGVNTKDVGDGYVIKLTHKIDRKIDESVLESVMKQLRDMGTNPDTLIESKPSLVLKSYRMLDENTVKVFDQALTIKPGSPTVEIVHPKGK